MDKERGFYRRVLAIALPIMIQNGITNFVNLLDNIMVGQLGVEQMAGASIVNQLIFVYNLCIFGGLAGAGIWDYGVGRAHTGQLWNGTDKKLFDFRRHRTYASGRKQLPAYSAVEYARFRIATGLCEHVEGMRRNKTPHVGLYDFSFHKAGFELSSDLWKIWISENGDRRSRNCHGCGAVCGT